MGQGCFCVECNTDVQRRMTIAKYVLYPSPKTGNLAIDSAERSSLKCTENGEKMGWALQRHQTHISPWFQKTVIQLLLSKKFAAIMKEIYLFLCLLVLYSIPTLYVSMDCVGACFF